MDYTTCYCRSRRCSMFGKTGSLAQLKLHDGNMVSRDFVAKYAAPLFPQAAAQRMRVFAQIWKSTGVEQKRWQKD